MGSISRVTVQQELKNEILATYHKNSFKTVFKFLKSSFMK